jgi:hypothetical protein
MSAETSACPCASTQDPHVISNAPGLPAIAYRANDFTGFRRALLRPLPGEQTIASWRPDRGDLGLQVLEWWAYLADVLTFYNERYANESYLGTATQQGSIANLVALLGYQPGPGIAATGMVAAMGPAGQSTGKLVIPAGMSLSSTASPNVPAQTFEVDSAVTFTGQSSVPVSLHPNTDLVRWRGGSPRSVLLAGRVSGVKTGDRLILVDRSFAGKNDHWSLVTISAVEPATDPATGAINTHIGFRQGGWGPTPAAAGAAARHGQPSDTTRYRLLRPTATAAIIDPAALANTTTDPEGKDPLELVRIRPYGDRRLERVHLSAAVRAIAPGDLVLFDRGAGNPSALAVVTGTSEALWNFPFPGAPSGSSVPDIVVAHTVLGIATADSRILFHAQDDHALDGIAVRYGFRDVGTIIGVPRPTLDSLPATVAAPFAPTAAVAALLEDTAGAGVAVTVTVSPDGSGDVVVTDTDASAMSESKSLAVPLRLLLNLVSVSRGTTVTNEVLGSGNAAIASQSFTLAKSPLTYRGTAAAATSTLSVTVDNIEWKEVPSFYNQAPNAQVFTVTRSSDQTVTTVTFGDGVNGARLTSGTGNVAASYRYGSGAASPPAGRLTTISQPQLNLASIQNPVAVSGGADPQSDSDVRKAAPASVITFRRAISASDYAEIASQAPSVSRAAADSATGGTGQRMLVTVYVRGGRTAVSDAASALAEVEHPSRQVVAAAASVTELSLSCLLVVAAGRQASTVVAAARAAVSSLAGGLFSPSRMGIGQPLYRSAIDAALMVPGVTAVHELEVTGPGLVLGEVLDPGAGAYFDLPDSAIHIEAVTAGG